MQPVVINQFLGIMNVDSSRMIPINACTDVIDVDISNTGSFYRRNGCSLAKSVSGLTSAYTTYDGVSYIVHDGLLSRIDATLTFHDLAPSTATEFTDFGNVLFTNDGLMVRDDRVIDLKLPMPDDAPQIYAAAGNDLPGVYTVTYVYRRISDGMEGASAPVSQITLSANQTVVMVPPTAIAGYEVITYKTQAGGTVFYNYAGVPLHPSQILANPMPLQSKAIAYHQTRLYATVPVEGNRTAVYFSDAGYFHFWDVVRNFIVVPGDVRALMTTGNELIIGTDAAVYAYNNEELSLLAAYGVPKGRPFTRMPTGEVMMMSKRGVCKAMPFENLTELKALFAVGGNCSTAYVMQDGIKKFVTLSESLTTPLNTKR